MQSAHGSEARGIQRSRVAERRREAERRSGRIAALRQEFVGDSGRPDDPNGKPRRFSGGDRRRRSVVVTDERLPVLGRCCVPVVSVFPLLHTRISKRQADRERGDGVSHVRDWDRLTKAMNRDVGPDWLVH